jgi:hypothetical protein
MGDGYRRIGAGEHRRGSSAVRDDTETLERGMFHVKHRETPHRSLTHEARPGRIGR